MTAEFSPFGMLIFLFSFTEQTIAQRDLWALWFIPDNTSITGCSCQKYNFIWSQDFPLLQFGYCIWPTTIQLELLYVYGACPYIAHYNNTALSTVVSYSFQIQLPYNASLLNEFIWRVHVWATKSKCAESVKVAMALHYTHTLWNAVSARNVVMDGSCTISISWNFSK